MNLPGRFLVLGGLVGLAACSSERNVRDEVLPLAARHLMERQPEPRPMTLWPYWGWTPPDSTRIPDDLLDELRAVTGLETTTLAAVRNHEVGAVLTFHAVRAERLDSVAVYATWDFPAVDDDDIGWGWEFDLFYDCTEGCRLLVVHEGSYN